MYRSVSYKVRQLFVVSGASVNLTDVTATHQVFMTTFPVAAYKHAVVLFPVCNLIINTFLEQTEKVTKFCMIMD